MRPNPPLADEPVELAAAPPRLVVTTVKDVTPAAVARAAEVAAACGAVAVTRHGNLATLLAEHGAELAYVVGRDGEWVEVPGGTRLEVHRGMLGSRRAAGGIHPLIRALAPPGEAPPVRILDATLGLALDAIHVADVLGVEVVGVEVSPILAALAASGLAREITRGLASASRVTVLCGDAADVLAAMPSGAVDAVYVDEMFARPRRSAPGFTLLRRLAAHAPLGERFWREARRVAARRVVVKRPRDSVDPAASPFDELVIGQAMAYGVLRCGAG